MNKLLLIAVLVTAAACTDHVTAPSPAPSRWTPRRSQLTESDTLGWQCWGELVQNPNTGQWEYVVLGCRRVPR